MSTARYFTGDALEVLRTLPDDSVDLVLTSPPFLALRSYLPADHPDKALELRRVLAPHGSLCVELGDTYSGSGGAGGDYAEGGFRDGAPGFTGSAAAERGPRGGAHRALDDNGGGHHYGGCGWPLAKSLCMVPQSFAFALAYGRNPWTGRELEPWRVRNVVRWCRPNPPVGALGDKFRPATSEMVVACVGGSRYFDLDAVRTELTEPGRVWDQGKKRSELQPHRNGKAIDQNPAGAPPLDYWVIPTHGFPGSHYATFPPELCVKPIKAMCPEKVCRVCGRPSERITEGVTVGAYGKPDPHEPLRLAAGGHMGTRSVETLGWTDCGCLCPACEYAGGPMDLETNNFERCDHKWRRGIVLDPFAGSGTTLEVATGHGRDAIGIDLDPRNADLARQRVGMFLVEEPAA